MSPNATPDATCTECGRLVAPGESETIAGKTVCKACVAQIRARVAADLNAAETPRYNSTAPGQAGDYQAPARPVRVAASGEGTALHLLLGAAMGLAVGLVGAFIYDKFVFYTRIQFGLITSFIGFGVGVAVVTGGRRFGTLPAVIGGVIALFCMIFSYQLLFNDQAVAAGKPPPLTYDPIGFINTIMNLNIMDWVFIAIGVYGAAKVPLRRSA